MYIHVCFLVIFVRFKTKQCHSFFRTERSVVASMRVLPIWHSAFVSCELMYWVYVVFLCSLFAAMSKLGTHCWNGISAFVSCELMYSAHALSLRFVPMLCVCSRPVNLLSRYLSLSSAMSKLGTYVLVSVEMVSWRTFGIKTFFSPAAAVIVLCYLHTCVHKSLLYSAYKFDRDTMHLRVVWVNWHA